MKFLNSLIVSCALLFGACTNDDFIDQGMTILETGIIICIRRTRRMVMYILQEGIFIVGARKIL